MYKFYSAVLKWNKERNNLMFNSQLEDKMFAEEVKEWQRGILEDDIVEILDGYCDAWFVHLGTVSKELTTLGSIQPNNLLRDETLRTMHEITYNKVKAYVSPTISVQDILNECMEAVVDANNLKPLDSTKGKVVKGDRWIDPKYVIKEIIDDEG